MNPSRVLKKPYLIMIFVSMQLFMGMSAQVIAQEHPRWYRPLQVQQGQKIFEQNCIQCHKKNAKGTANWKTPLPGGIYPPPPLNGTAHTWHHGLNILKRVIDEGGIARGGKMPGFKNQLSEIEKEAVIAYFQHFWSDEIYDMWRQRNAKK